MTTKILPAVLLAMVAAVAAWFVVPRSQQEPGPEKGSQAPGGKRALDFESGDLSQWDLVQSAEPDRLTVVRNPARQGRFAGRFEVRKGDTPRDTTGTRTELIGDFKHKPRAGEERTYAWSTLFPRSYPIVDEWQTFVQWKNDGTGSPPLAMTVEGDELRLSGGKQDGFHLYWRGPIRRGRWHDFVARIRWSPDKREGSIRLWHDGREVVPRTSAATMYRDDDGKPIPNYLKLGLYRSGAIRETQVLFHDAMRIR